MDTLKQLELKYSKDFHGYFEDLAALLFCVKYNQTQGVNRRINQPGIEADPIIIGKERIAFQAKYYSDAVNLSDRKDDLLRTVNEAAREGVTKLIIYTNKDHSSTKNQKDDESKIAPRVKPTYEQEIDALAKTHSMVVEWQTGSSINTTLEMPQYRYIRELYLGSENSKNGFMDFYNYALEKLLTHEKDCVYGDIPLKDGYMDPFIEVDKNPRSLKSHLFEWLSAQNNVTASTKAQIMVIYGEPGHGKTSLCYKAMYDYYKEGWLSGIVDNVFHISLNPSFTDAVQDGKIDIRGLLCWGELRQNKLNFSDFNNALVFFDGFDELIDYMPSLTISEFVKTYITRFVAITHAKVVITSRRMGIERELSYDAVSNKYYIQGIPKYPVFELLPLTKDQQTDWISDYIQYCDMQSKSDTDTDYYWATKVNKLIEYRKLFEKAQKHQSSNNSIILLSIPLIFRMIVEFQYPPNRLSDSVSLYEDLFEATWKRRSVEWPYQNTKGKTIELLALHAFKCFQEGADSAVTDTNLEFFWTYQFYTKAIRTSEVTTILNDEANHSQRVGFLHRTFYQYYLAKHVILALIDSKNQSDSHLRKEVLARLSRDKLDSTTLSYIKELYCLLSPNEKAYVERTVGIISSIIKQTDAVLPEIYDMDWIKEDSAHGRIPPLEACNNLFWNMASIYTLTGHSNASVFCSSSALRHYTLKGANLESWNLDGFNLYRTNFEGANLRGASLKGTNLQGAFLKEAILITAHLEKANLKSAQLGWAHLTGAHLEGANLEEAHLEEVQLENSTLEEAHLEGAHLEGARLEDTILKRAHLEGAHLEEAHLERAHLEGAHLEGIHHKGAHFDGVYIEGAYYDKDFIDGFIMIK